MRRTGLGTTLAAPPVAGLAALIALVGLAAAPAARAQGDAARGAAPYQKYCAQCHGETGDAQGPAAHFMLPRPRVFLENASYKFRTTPSGELPTDQDLLDIITRGIPGTAMPGFGAVPESQRRDIVAFIKSLSPDFSDPSYTDAAIPMPELAASRPAPPTEESLTRGQELYDENKCWQCHGEEGRGDGTSWPDLKDEWGDAILPANLTNTDRYRAGATPADVYRTISTGFNGTPMPAYSDSITPEDRWHLVNYVLSMGPDPSWRGEAVVARRVEALPDSAEHEAWASLPRTRFATFANVVEAPRLYWPSVEFITVRAAYDETDIALLIQWDDRSPSEGTTVDQEYQDRDGTNYIQTDHPDQLAVQFPAKGGDPKVRPYFLFGDNKRPVNLWWWRSDAEGLRELNAKGFGTFEAQADENQALQGGVTHDKGRYTLYVRRSLTTADARRDVQVEPGSFIPIAFHAWDGQRGELGQRRALTTWYWLYAEPPIPKARYVAKAAVVGLLTFGLLGFVVVRTRRANAPA